MAEYKSMPLFGGAIVADLPSSYIDASDLRQIPDHQEVYLDNNGFASIVIEILERVDAPNDSDAFLAHLRDLTGEDVGVSVSGAGVQAWPVSAARKLANDIQIYTLDANAPPSVAEQKRMVASVRSERQSVDVTVGLALALVRLPAQQTDLLIAVNVPGERHGTGQNTGDQIRKRLVETLEIRDMGLFG